jgi:hypothetical protein
MQRQAASCEPPAAGATQPAVVVALPCMPLPCWRAEQFAVVAAGSRAERELLLGAVAVAGYTAEVLLQTIIALHLSAQQQLGRSGSGSWGPLGCQDLLWSDLAFVRSLPQQLLQQAAQAMLPQGTALSQVLLVPAARTGGLTAPCPASSAQLATALGVRLPMPKRSQPGAAVAGAQPRLFSVPRPVLAASSGATARLAGSSSNSSSQEEADEVPASAAATLQCEVLLWEAFFVRLRSSGASTSTSTSCQLAAAEEGAASMIWAHIPMELAVQHAAASGQLLPAFQDLSPKAAQMAEVVVHSLPAGLLAMVCSTPIPGRSNVQPAQPPEGSSLVDQQLQQAVAPVSQAFCQALFGAEAPFTVVVPEHCRGLAAQLGVQLEHSFDGCVAALGFLVQSGCRDVDRWVAGWMQEVLPDMHAATTFLGQTLAPIQSRRPAAAGTCAG